MLAIMTKTVMGITPREWDRTPRGGSIEPLTEVRQKEELRDATEEELYQGGFRTKLIEDERGNICIEKQGEKIFCNP